MSLDATGHDPSLGPAFPVVTTSRQVWEALTRRALGTIYRLDQVEVWTATHASGNEVAVARKALRLCGVDPGEGPLGINDVEREVDALEARAERNRTLDASVQTFREAGGHQTVPRKDHGRLADRCSDNAMTREVGSNVRHPGTITPTVPGLADLDELLRRVIDLAATTIEGADHVGIALAEHHDLGARVWTDPVPRILDGVQGSIGQGPSLDAMLDTHTIEVDDLETDSRWPAFTERALARTGVHSILAVPLTLDGQVLGSMNVLSSHDHAFDEDDRATAVALAAHASVLIRAGQIREDLCRTLAAQGQGGSPEDGVGDARLPEDDEPFAKIRAASQRTRRRYRPDADEADAPVPKTRSEVVTDLRAQEVVISAVRRMVVCESREEIDEVLLHAVDALGGRIVKADHGDETAIPVSLVGSPAVPLLAVPDPVTWSSRHLHAHLPRLVEDARNAVARLERSEQLIADADVDALTGLLNRRGYERLAGRLETGDVLVLLDLDDFKAVNDTHGHGAGDRVLRSFASVLREQVRASEYAIRLGGDEFLVVLRDVDTAASKLFLRRLRRAWERQRPQPVDISAGVATVGKRVDLALESADRDLYDHKHRHELPRKGKR
jgi:diguanylate cyclase (GGDEF)-like protein